MTCVVQQLQQDNNNMKVLIPDLYCVALWVITLLLIREGNRQLNLFSDKVFYLFLNVHQNRLVHETISNFCTSSFAI